MSSTEEAYVVAKVRAQDGIKEVKTLGEKLGFEEDDILSDIEDMLANLGFAKTSIT